MRVERSEWPSVTEERDYQSVEWHNYRYPDADGRNHNPSELSAVPMQRALDRVQRLGDFGADLCLARLVLGVDERLGDGNDTALPV